MAVTLDDLALHVINKAPDKLTDRERADLDSLLAWTVAMVDRYLSGSVAPDAVRDAAIKRCAYYDWHSRTVRQPADGGMLDAVFRRDKSTNPLRASGSMALLSPYLRRRAAS